MTNMQKIFDFDTSNTRIEKSKSSSIISKIILDESELNKPLSEASLLKRHPIKAACKWDTIEPPKLVKSNMTSATLKVDSVQHKESQLPRKNASMSPEIFAYKKVSQRKNSLKKKFKTFDDVKIILNDDQLKEFREIIDMLFRKVRLYEHKISYSFN